LKWIIDVQERFPNLFHDKNVLEVGAAGSPVPRDRFINCTYTGVDIVPDPELVDIQANINNVAEETLPRKSFDVVVFLSVLEHDPNWPITLHNVVDFLKPGGVMIMCLGVEGNAHHGPEPWAPVPHKDFLRKVCDEPVTILMALYEEAWYGSDCHGCFDLVLKRQDENDPLAYLHDYLPPFDGRVDTDDVMIDGVVLTRDIAGVNQETSRWELPEEEWPHL
jgi:SAM-dependent methyltransferase